MSPDLDSVDPPDYLNWERDRERFKQSVPEPYKVWEQAYAKMATAKELSNASEGEVAAATLRAIIKALP